jgi:hypothetical protein
MEYISNNNAGLDGPHFELIVFLLQLPAQLLQLVLQSGRLAKFGTSGVLVFLHLICTLLLLDAFAFMALHFGKQLSRSPMQKIDLLHLRHLRRLGVELSICLLDFPICISFVSPDPFPIHLSSSRPAPSGQFPCPRIKKHPLHYARALPNEPGASPTKVFLQTPRR